MPGQCALTLVEVLVAVTILSLALLAYLSVSLASRGQVDKGNYYTLAAQAAGDQIAGAQGNGFNTLVNGTTTYTVAGLPQGQMTVVVGPLDGDANNKAITQVDVTVTWGAGSTRTPETAGSVKQTIVISDRK